MITLLLTAYTFMQNQRDRRLKVLKERADAVYEWVISAYEMNLSEGEGRRVLEVLPEHRVFVVRAVREGRLAWTGFENMVGLPRASLDA
ncbi:MAG TPA: hypothetical protein VMT03_26755 [Polyangia bacterium]|nr:hypothetical protein [Polyangia bacterium]